MCFKISQQKWMKSDFLNQTAWHFDEIRHYRIFSTLLIENILYPSKSEKLWICSMDKWKHVCEKVVWGLYPTCIWWARNLAIVRLREEAEHVQLEGSVGSCVASGVESCLVDRRDQGSFADLVWGRLTRKRSWGLPLMPLLRLIALPSLSFYWTLYESWCSRLHPQDWLCSASTSDLETLIILDSDTCSLDH